VKLGVDTTFGFCEAQFTTGRSEHGWIKVIDWQLNAQMTGICISDYAQ
jgi:hypothetical protein